MIPRTRVLVIVSEHHREEATPQLAHWPSENVIFQPENRDTAPGILLPLAHIDRRESFATVAIFPSDHFILDEARFMDAVQMAITETQRFPTSLTLLGMTPTGLDEGYGWIEPGPPQNFCTTRPVSRFWEKPTPLQAYKLLRRGALWNSFVGVAKANTLWEMTQLTAPILFEDFMCIRRALRSPHGQEITEHGYRAMQAVNFSTDICQPLAARLRVLPTPDVGWSDWGSEERICSSLHRLSTFGGCLAGLQHHKEMSAISWRSRLQTPRDVL